MSNAALRGAWSALLLLIPAAFCSAEDEKGAKEIARARELLKLLVAEEYEAFTAAGDETMKASFTVDVAARNWRWGTLQLGDYEGEQSAEHIKTGDYDTVRFICRFSDGTLTLRIVLDAQGRLSGFWLDAVEPIDRYGAPDYVDKNAFREQSVTVSAGLFPLPGTLSIPTSDGPHPVVVLVHGSGPHDQDETVFGTKPFRDLAWGLASKGVAVLRYEKRTKKYPTAVKPEDCTLEMETIADALAAVKLARQLPKIDGKRVYIAGHSLGGMAAPYIAQRDGELGGIIIMAGGARSILDSIADQIEYLTRLDGEISEEERKRLDETHTALAGIRAGSPEVLKKKLLGVPNAYWYRLNKLDPVEAASKLKIPIMVIHGKRDYQVTMADYKTWRKRLGARSNVTLSLYGQLNHLFVLGDGPPSPLEYRVAGHVHKQVIDDIAKWIKSR